MMASLLSLFGVILWSLAAFRPLGETLGTLPSHRSEVVSYYVECLLRASHGHVRHLLAGQPVRERSQTGGGGGEGAPPTGGPAASCGGQQARDDRSPFAIPSGAAR